MRVTVRVLVVVGLLAAVLVGGLASLYASGDPDGLNRVAADEGMAAKEEAHALEDGPFAGYESPLDSSLSGGVAAVVGISATFVVAGGLMFAVRRRGRSTSADAPGPAPGR